MDAKTENLQKPFVVLIKKSSAADEHKQQADRSEMAIWDMRCDTHKPRQHSNRQQFMRRIVK